MVEPPLCFEYTVCADPLGDADQGSNQYDRQPRPVQFLRQRSAATRPGPSSRRENDRLDTM